MNTEDDFRRALLRETQDTRGDTTLLPSALAVAAVEALPPVAGASLSVMSADLRIPLGSSNAHAAAAEAAQTTLGEGPCLRAIADRTMVEAPAAVLREQWPELERIWTSQTPYRSSLSVPVPLSRDVGCSLNLYFTAHPTDSGEAHDVDRSAATIVGALVADQLLATMPPSSEDESLAASWLLAPNAHRRQRVWVAIGRVMQAAQMTAADALDLLRGRAFVQDRSIDDLVVDVIASSDLVTLLEL